jgi:HEAT repeat protein
LFEESDARTRSALLEALGELGDASDGVLFASLARKAEDPAERLQALRLGAVIAPSAMAEVAFELAEDPNTPAEVASACLKLLALDGAATPALCEARFDLGARLCESDSVEVRRAACTLLAVAKPADALPQLVPLLQDAAVRSAAFEALASTADPRAARIFAQGLGDADPALRSAARRAIARSKSEMLPAIEGLVSRQELNGAVVRELRALYSGQQPILAWEVFGPLADDAPESALEFDAEHAAESRADLQACELLRLHTTVSERADGMIDLRKLLTDKSQQCAYAFATLRSSSEREVELHAGSDDQLRVWLNGVLVHEYDGARAFSAESDQFRTRLIAGDNHFALRIGQIGGDWSFALTVPEEGRGPLFETKLPLQPSTAEYAAFAEDHPGDAARGEQVDV